MGCRHKIPLPGGDSVRRRALSHALRSNFPLPCIRRCPAQCFHWRATFTQAPTSGPVRAAGWAPAAPEAPTSLPKDASTYGHCSSARGRPSLKAGAQSPPMSPCCHGVSPLGDPAEMARPLCSASADASPGSPRRVRGPLQRPSPPPLARSDGGLAPQGRSRRSGFPYHPCRMNRPAQWPHPRRCAGGVTWMDFGTHGDSG